MSTADTNSPGAPAGSFGPAARGQRLPWDALPPPVRAAIEHRLGSPVVEARTQAGGFSPGVAARLQLEDGRRAFIKAVSIHANPDSPKLHRRESGIAAALPPSVPVPRLLWSYDDGEWVALAFEDVDGREPALPWRPDELRRVLDMITNLAAALTPSPIDAPSVSELLERTFTGWRRLVDEPTLHGAFDPWVIRHLDQLAELECQWPGGALGTTLLHTDLRADNIILTADQVLVVDWPWASIGAPWLDLVFFLPSVAMQGGPSPWKIFDRHPLGAAAPHDAVTTVVAGLAGFFLFAGLQPPPPGLPTLREFQWAQGLPALDWLRRRTGWE